MWCLLIMFVNEFSAATAHGSITNDNNGPLVAKSDDDDENGRRQINPGWSCHVGSL